MALCKFKVVGSGPATEDWDLRLTNIPRIGDNVTIIEQDGTESAFLVRSVEILLARDKQGKVIHTYNDETNVYVKKL